MLHLRYRTVWYRWISLLCLFKCAPTIYGLLLTTSRCVCVCVLVFDYTTFIEMIVTIAKSPSPSLPNINYIFSYNCFPWLFLPVFHFFLVLTGFSYLVQSTEIGTYFSIQVFPFICFRRVCVLFQITFSIYCFYSV